MDKARRLAQRVRLRREPDERALPGTPGDEAGGAGSAATDPPQGGAVEPGPDDAAARIDAARARLRATIESPADPDT